MTSISLTFKCNQNCVTCILLMPQAMKMRATSFKDAIMEVNKQPYRGIVQLTGGEPALAPYFFNLLRHIKQNRPDLYTFLLSNGRIMASKKFVRKLKESAPPFFRVAVAFYSHKPELHDYITLTKGAFKEAVTGVKNLIREGIKTEVRFIINRANYKEVGEFAKFASKEFLGIDRLVFINMKYTGNARKNADKFFVKLSEVAKYIHEAVDNSIFERTYLYHMPLCLIPKRLWKYAEGITKEEEELTFAPQCEECAVKNRCPRIWKTYAEIAGFDEFKPIGDENGNKS